MFVKPRSAFVGCPSLVASSSGSAKNARYARLLPSTRKRSDSRAGASSSSSSCPVSVFGTQARVDLGRCRRRDRFSPRAPAVMTRVPLLAGTRIAVVDAADGVVLRPPPPGKAIADVGAAVREAMRYPLAGEPLERLTTRGGTATVVVEPPHLPIPASAWDPRQEAVAAAIDELERLGVAQVTVLIATGLHQRLSPKEIGLLFRPEFRRRFRGRVIVHDAEADDLVELG